MSGADRVAIAVLASGGGSNLEAILEAERQGKLGRGHVAVVLSNVAGAGALERAARFGVPTEVIPHGDFPSREDFDDAVLGRLEKYRVEWLVLAGFMRIVTPRIIDAYPKRIVNIHPSLLPSFPGLHAQRQALRHGVKVSGCTVHLVDAGLDSGPILAQAAVPVLPGDDEDTLSARILVEEHKLYAATLATLL